jgi:eukaryotic-like serine/threonine-protein kinase
VTWLSVRSLQKLSSVPTVPYFGSLPFAHTTLRGDYPYASSGSAARLSSRQDTGERYVVEAEIARGGHATVLRAQDRKLRRQVAIKQLRNKRPRSEFRFMNEALLTARLQHPSIVPIFDVGSWPDGTLYFAMQLVRGATLAERIASAADRAERLSLIPAVIAVTDAVAYAHRQGVIHRDLKPHNVLVGDLGETIVIDWGIAKVLAEDEIVHDESDSVGVTHTASGSVVGTPHYMSPEQATGADVDERTDVYALGAMLYHVIAGDPPFADLPRESVIEAVRSRPPAPLADAGADIPPALIRLVERAMARDPDARYRSATELREDLIPSAARRSGDRAARAR